VNPRTSYWMWATGTHDVTVTIGLDWKKSYLVTGALTLTDGDDYAHVYISTVCTYTGSQVLCGVRDVGGDFGVGLNEFISSATKVTIKLRTKGGSHRAEGVVYEL